MQTQTKCAVTIVIFGHFNQSFFILLYVKQWQHTTLQQAYSPTFPQYTGEPLSSRKSFYNQLLNMTS